MDRIVWDFEIQEIIPYCCVKIKENEKETKTKTENYEALEHEGDSDTNSNWCTRNDPQRLSKKAGRVRNPKTSRYHPTTALLISARILRKILESCCHLDSSERPANAAVKNSQRVILYQY